jgi:hypothetical protein
MILGMKYQVNRDGRLVYSVTIIGPDYPDVSPVGGEILLWGYHETPAKT